MSKRSQLFLRVGFLIVIGVIAIVAIIMAAELSVIAKKTPASDPKLRVNQQSAYPPPGLARANPAVQPQVSYPPPSTAPLAPTKKVIPSPTTDKGGLTLANVQRTTVKDAKVALDGKKAVFVDVRTKSAYDNSHIPGAISIPESQIMTRIKELDPNQWIITYCS
jgi:hypothetical protein